MERRLITCKFSKWKVVSDVDSQQRHEDHVFLHSNRTQLASEVPTFNKLFEIITLIGSFPEHIDLKQNFTLILNLRSD